jgi:hypothetical protein
VVPKAMDGVGGWRVIEANTAGVTVRLAEAVTVSAVIEMVAAPVPTVLATPCVGAELLVVATVASDELQCPE